MVERNTSMISQEAGKFGNQVADIKDISFSSPDRMLFTDVNLTINRGENIVVIGKSGVGKTTLVKILLGNIPPDTGTVTIASGVKISYVPQDPDDLEIDDNITVKDLYYNARGLTTISKRKAQLEDMMTDQTDSNELNSILEEYDKVSEQFDRMGGYSADAEIDLLLAGLKLDKKTTGHITQETRLNQVSSGQKTRLLIGQALFANADLLIMDDPTSHLDVSSVEWLGRYLKKSKQASFIATNNVTFIEACANKVVEITDFGRILTFEGGYNSYIEKRDRLLEAERTEAESVKNEHDRLQATYQDFKSRQVFRRSANMAQVGRALQSRMVRLDDRYKNLPGSKQVEIDQRIKPLVFKCGTRSGNDVLLIQGVTKNYEDFTALDLKNLTLPLRRGQCLIISGENGSGKSTLMKMIISAIEGGSFNPDAGNINIGTGIKLGYYSPDNAQVSKSGNILDEVRKATLKGNEGEAVSALIYWGIPKNTLRTKQLEQLSPGEKKQVALAKLMVQQPNLLLLDEPTDYLRPEIIERLVSALKGYDGTLIIVSHNQDFAKQLTFDYELKLPEGILVVKGK
jgi:ATPase subunit of ABC transporter with duplicated ATPase domains